MGKENKQPKVSGIKEIIYIRIEINEIDNRKTLEKINKHCWLFEKIKKIDNPTR